MANHLASLSDLSKRLYMLEIKLDIAKEMVMGELWNDRHDKNVYLEDTPMKIISN